MIVLVMAGIAVCVLILVAIRTSPPPTLSTIERARKRERIVSTIPGPRHESLDIFDRKEV